MIKTVKIVMVMLYTSVSLLGVGFILSCESNNIDGLNEAPATLTLHEVIQEVFTNNPNPQATYILEGFVKQIDNRILLIERADKIVVIADIKEQTRIEYLDPFEEGHLASYKLLPFKDIVVGDTVELWIQIMADGSYEQTRLLVTTYIS